MVNLWLHHGCVGKAILVFWLIGMGQVLRGIGMRNLHYHRITEWLVLEGTLRLILSHRCHGQGHFSLDEIAQSSIQPGPSPTFYHGEEVPGENS